MTLLRLFLVVLRVAVLGMVVGAILYAVGGAASCSTDALDTAFGVPK